MLDHNWLINPTKFVTQKYKNECFVLVIVAYDEVDNIIKIVEHRKRWNNEMPKNLIPLLLCQIGRNPT